jgi:hypothetical protein
MWLGDWLEGARGHRVITGEEATSWLEDLAQRHAAGRFLYGSTVVSATARTPESAERQERRTM